MKKKSIFVVALAALMLVAFSACENQVPTYKVPVSMTATASKTEYLSGELLDPSAITATVLFSDGSSETYPGTMVGATATKLGTKGVGEEAIALSYGTEKHPVSTSLKVMVYGVESITLDNLPETAAWDSTKKHGVIDQSGITATVTYNYGKGTRTLTSDEFVMETNENTFTTGGAEDVSVKVTKFTVFQASADVSSLISNIENWKVDVAEASMGTFSSTFLNSARKAADYEIRFYHEDGTEVADDNDDVYINERLSWGIYLVEKSSSVVVAERELDSDEFYFVQNEGPESTIRLTAEMMTTQAKYNVWIPAISSGTKSIAFDVPQPADYVIDVEGIAAKERLKSLVVDTTIASTEITKYFDINIVLASDPSAKAKAWTSEEGLSVYLLDPTVDVSTGEYDPTLYISFGMPGNMSTPAPMTLDEPVIYDVE